MVSEPLMVCPQELYSLEAIRAFADSRQFIGVVCTACMPRNLTAPSICGADLLLPAQDSFFGFPVFKRHYWTGMSNFAMSLFLGKSAILVEHHEFFRNGPGAAENFVSELSKLNPRIQWTSLAETAKRTHLRRRLSENQHEVRFFTDDFNLEHAGETPAEYRLIRRIPATTIVRRLMVNGVETPFATRERFPRIRAAGRRSTSFSRPSRGGSHQAGEGIFDRGQIPGSRRCSARLVGIPGQCHRPKRFRFASRQIGGENFEANQRLTKSEKCAAFADKLKSPATSRWIKKRSAGWRRRFFIAARMTTAIFSTARVGLGFRRLSIIDLSGGHQPMADAEKSVWLVFNGEIYNYKELRAELEARGHKFQTSSDTEVIIYGYKEWGLDVFNHLNGMFGVAIWDVKKTAAGRRARRDGHQADLLQNSERHFEFRFGNPARDRSG